MVMSAALFPESSGRFLVEVASEDAAAFEEALTGQPVACLGRVTSDGRLRVRGLQGSLVLACDVADLLGAWQSPEVV